MQSPDEVIEMRRIVNGREHVNHHPPNTKDSGLGERLITVLEAERGKIAREIHDEAGQLLISAAFRLDQAIALLPKAFVAREQLEQARQALDECAETLHRLAFNLRPRMLDDLGLIPALHSYLRRYADLGSVKLEVHLEQPGQKLQAPTELAIFRIVQEAVANVRKHSQATTVCIDLRFTAELAELRISDDGVGFEPTALGHVRAARPRLGIQGMRERAAALGGEIQLESGRFIGTTIRARLPIGGVRDGS